MPALRPALIVFAKAPVPGRVKTRLTPPLAPPDAAALYGAFLGDALAAYAGPDAFGLGRDVPVRLYLGTADALPPGLVPPGVSRHAQRGDGLGARMLRAFAETFAAGHDAAVVIGTDHPLLPLAFVGEAFRALAAPLTLALGPTGDGGYYLLGTGELVPALFQMDYSHPAVFADTLARAFEAGLQPVVLPPHDDVDDAGDLARLLALAEAGATVPPRTALALARLARAYPALRDPGRDAPPSRGDQDGSSG